MAYCFIVCDPMYHETKLFEFSKFSTTLTRGQNLLMEKKRKNFIFDMVLRPVTYLLPKSFLKRKIDNRFMVQQPFDIFPAENHFGMLLFLSFPSDPALPY